MTNFEELIVGRIKEKDKLKNMLDSNKAELHFFYGRRRIGKTYLIENYCKGKGFFVYFRAEKKEDVKSLKSRLIKEFEAVLIAEGITFEKIKGIKTWTDVFNTLAVYISLVSDKKIILFIDELPWLQKDVRDSFKISFSQFWNRHFANNPDRANVKLICSGSATNWIMNELNDDSGGLFHRGNTTKISPFTLKEVHDFFKFKNKHLTNKEIVILYMIFGGIPEYLGKIENGESVDQFIDRAFFNTDPIFKNEFKELIEGTFVSTDIQPYLLIIEFIGKSKKGVTAKDIKEFLDANSHKLNGTKRKNYIEDLLNCDVLSKQNYFNPDTTVIGEIHYKVNDEFIYFYFYWIEKYKNIYNASWSNLKATTDHSSWGGEIFERICFKNLESVAKVANIKCMFSAHWWKDFDNKDSKEIDILLNRDDETLTIIEIKFYKAPLNFSEISKDLEDKKTSLQLYLDNFRDIKTTKRNKAKKINIITISVEGITVTKQSQQKEIYLSVSKNIKLEEII